MPQTLLGTKKSSNIADNGVKYDDRKHILSVTFKSGPTYDYPKVPVSIGKGFLTAESTGEYFAENIRNTFEGIKRK